MRICRGAVFLVILICYEQLAGFGFEPDTGAVSAPENLSAPVREAPALTARQVIRNLQAKTFSGKPVELNFANESLAGILARFEEISGLKFKISPGIGAGRREGKHYRFSGQPWDKALASILAEYGLEVRLEGDALMVDRFTPEEDRSVPAFLIGISTALAGTGVTLLVLMLRKRRRQKMERDRRISLAPAMVDETIQRLNYLFQIEKIHRNGRLTLDSLSERLALQPHQLSGIINSRMGKTFTDLVADYRVEEVKRRLADPAETAAILNIAFDAGFGTKASFNRIFKERTRLTPSEFKKKRIPVK